MQRRFSRSLSAHVVRFALPLVLVLAGMFAPSAVVPAQARTVAGNYTNPLSIKVPGDGKVESCADPSIIHSEVSGDTNWYLYCTSDPLNDKDRAANGDFNFHLISIHKSSDLVNWTYIGDAFKERPSWLAPDSGTWAPDIEYFNGKYYLYYTAPDTKAGGSAIGVATSASPAGPWVDSGGPVVEPGANGPDRWVFDPDVVEANGQKYIYFGSYFGGVSARKLSADGLHSDAKSQKAITIPNRYEGTDIVKHGDYFYLFASATNCCNGPLTGYSIFAGRSKNPLGPFVDKQGISLLKGRVGGTPVISMNGNRWVGPGHNAVFTDFGGQDWIVYHAIDRNDPYFADPNPDRINKRAALIDPLDWVDGWPTVRGGLWASDSSQPAPAAQPGEESRYKVKLAKVDVPSTQINRLSDEFSGNTLSSQWTWVRQPTADTFGVKNGTFRFDTQDTDLNGGNNSSVLTEPAPSGNYVVETRVKLNLPSEGCCQNYVQAGLVIYGDDDNYIKLVHASIWETRQTEFAKEVGPVPAGYPTYGNTVVGPPATWTWLRIVKRTKGGEELYTAYTSNNGKTWVRGGVWTHKLGKNARIGLVSQVGKGFTANFDYVRVYRVKTQVLDND